MSAPSGPEVIKLGGSLLEDEEARRALLTEIARRARGEPLVLVHGGGKRIDAALAQRGIPKRTLAGLRVTDDPTLAVVVNVLGAVNRELVGELRLLDAPAVGLAGHPWVLRAAVHPPVDGVALGHVGVVTGVDTAALDPTASRASLFVLAPLAAGPHGEPLNVNADSVAAAVAAAVAARRLVFLTDVEGVSDGAGRRIEQLDARGARRLLEGPAVTGGMRPKLQACLHAVAAGVGEIVIAGPERQREALAGGRGGTHVVAA